MIGRPWVQNLRHATLLSMMMIVLMMTLSQKWIFVVENFENFQNFENFHDSCEIVDEIVDEWGRR